jgi:NRPS condensation-like uncharacterized protein
MQRKFLRAEMWDKTQYLFRNYYDRMMHCVLYFDNRVEEKPFREALSFQLENVPVLHSRYHNNFIKPYWTVCDYTLDEVLTIKDSANVEADVYAFLTQQIPVTKNVQTQIALFNHGSKTAFCMVSNHMCFDGGDFKYFVTSLCRNYNALVSGDKKMYIKSGSRAYDCIYSSLSQEDKKTAKGLYKNISAVKDKHRFPLTAPKKDDKSMIVRHLMDARKFSALRAAGKKAGYTVNDVILALYIRALFELAGFDKNERLTVPNMVDLRRHLSDGGASLGLTNHTGFMPCTVDGIGDNILDTLNKVQEALKTAKQDKFLGLYSLPLLSLAYKVLPHFISEFAIKLGYDNPLTGMSNIGSINPEDYRMGGAVPEYGFYTGAIKYKPFMQLAFTTMNGEVTFTIAVRGNEEDEKIIKHFFELFDKNADSLIELTA